MLTTTCLWVRTVISFWQTLLRDVLVIQQMWDVQSLTLYQDLCFGLTSVCSTLLLNTQWCSSILSVYQQTELRTYSANNCNCIKLLQLLLRLESCWSLVEVRALLKAIFWPCCSYSLCCTFVLLYWLRKTTKSSISWMRGLLKLLITQIELWTGVNPRHEVNRSE